MIHLFKVNMCENAIIKAAEVLKSGYIGQGSVVEEFEKLLKNYYEWPYIVTTNSATSAEHLAFHMLREKYEGCEVLCSPLTCTASNWPILLNGYKIKWVDVDENTLNIDLKDLENKLSANTKIIYIVHWGGYPISYNEIIKVLYKCESKHGFRPIVIQDCAHAFGLDSMANKFETWATYSFQAIKHVTSVDGGALFCPDEETYKRAKLLRWYGIDRETNRKDFRCEDDIAEIGFKFHMNDVCAAIGMENLKSFDITRYKACARYYDKHIQSQWVRKIPYNDNCSYWLYTMFVENHDRFMEHMKKKGILVSRVHERNDKHSCVKKYKTNLPNLDKIVKEMICIPCGWWVTNENLKHITDSINEGGW